MNIKISTIIPIYKGIQYLQKQISQVENAAKLLPVAMELIFVNDDPKVPLPEDLQADGVEVVTLQTEENCGIQRARIKGLEVARGEYIHFLDQDDEISSQFYVSQWEQVGEADVIFCRCYNGNRQTYNRNRVFETAFEKEKMFRCCPMISPGQALIRKEVIPEFWKTHWLKRLGSDDYMLWLCMAAENVKAVCNQEILFRHVITGENYSSDVLKAYESDSEMAELLLRYEIFGKEDIEKLQNLPQVNLTRRYLPQKRHQVTLYTLEKLLKAQEQGRTLEHYLKERGYKKIAIYGAAILGERLYGLLKGSGIEVAFFIDYNAEFIEEEIPVYTIEQVSSEVDAILISNVTGEVQIENTIKEFMSVPVFCIRKVADALLQER